MINSYKVKSVSFILVIYILTGLIILFLVNKITFVNPFVKVLSADLAATIIIFLFSFILKNSSVYDPFWSVVPPVIAGYLVITHPEGNSTRQIIVMGVILLWSLRLTMNWIIGWNGLNHEDWRYKKIAKDTGRFYWLASFAGIHLVPTLFVYLGCLPLFYIFNDPSPISPFEIIALMVGLSAILLEWISDEQLRKFKKTAERNAIMMSGLWSVSRHPNYLGEIMFWLCLYLFIPLESFLHTFWTGFGFIGMILLFKFISIPLMDDHNLKYRPGYAIYRKNVPALLPKFRKLFIQK